MDLFAAGKPAEQTNPRNDPLALRMAPRDWNEFVGQNHLVGEGSLLRRAVEADRLGSAVFFGPPGTGKTALARLIAYKTKAHVEHTNAVTIGVPEIRKILQTAHERRRAQGRRSLLILDEIHHFNRSQQDALLPDVEKGVITLVGLTTENPFFYVNAALLSRSTVFEFFPLKNEDLRQILRWSLENKERGLGDRKILLSPEAETHFLETSGGDARRVLNALELAVLSTAPSRDGAVALTLAVAEASTQKRAVRYDKSSDDHYDTISAFIKSLRGSDPDAALYWMGKMLAAGEDPRFIARRLLIAASEDVGNADPLALLVANAAFDAVEKLGLPEGRIPLAQAVTYVASAPKSNAAYLAGDAAAGEVRQGPRREVPPHLRDANLDGAARGHGRGYKYAHDFPEHFVKQEYLPLWKKFYFPTDLGFEKKIKERLERLWPERKTEKDKP
ncbi:MAG TPA: replication-associated recombination protein A [Elusimicrobiota bacterium]|nr:replication-associated recombination protein A [Elusimicrobiota bacterium]